MFATLDFRRSAGVYWFPIDHKKRRAPHLIVMSMSIPRLTELPLEILEQILLHLPGQDIIKMDVVRRVTANSAGLRVDFSAAQSRQADNSTT